MATSVAVLLISVLALCEYPQRLYATVSPSVAVSGLNAAVSLSCLSAFAAVAGVKRNTFAAKPVGRNDRMSHGKLGLYAAEMSRMPSKWVTR